MDMAARFAPADLEISARRPRPAPWRGRAVESSSRTEPVALLDRSREIAFGRFRVRIVAGPEKGVARESTGAELTIGTAPQNGLVLHDPAVSRHHCVITATPRGFHVRDLGSTNGTFLADHRVESAYLEDGAILGVGESRLVFEILAGHVREPLSDGESHHHRVLGRSPEMRRIFALLPRLAASDATILIEGETGTGKGLLADAIHNESSRHQGPFVVVDCSAIPPTLIESELFGHEKGAFTDAQTARIGAFEAANGGTIFLDEIGELPLEVQPKLLRALEERVVRRLGSLDPVRLDVRVIAATNRDLRLEVNRGSFRADLFYRLDVVRLRIPALRERREDIPLLVAHFYEQLAREAGAKPPASLILDALERPWPGNVRELRGAVERALLLGVPSQSYDVEPIEAAPPPSAADRCAFELDLSRPFREAKEREVARWERAYLDALLRASSGNLSRAARAARMDRNHLRELVRRHGVRVSGE
jgi:DNA-binding NtrC family response regulator